MGNGSVCHLYTADAQLKYEYEWYKGDAAGRLYKSPYDPDEGDYGDNYDPALIPDIKVVLYPDAVVAGQECVVYGYEFQGMNMLYWFSKSKGFVILEETGMEYTPDMITATFTYDNKMVDKDDAFFDPNAQGVTTWNE